MNINQRSFFVRTFGVMLVVAGGALGMFALQAQAQTKVRLVYGAQPTSTSQYLQAVQHMNAIANLLK